jgi:CheY-like chemotaxis protein
LLGILNDVLDMSKIESGKFVLAYEAFALRAAMKEVAHIIAQRCAEKQIEFVTNFADVPDYSVIGDKLRLKQVLINLLGNAVKFTPDGGSIHFLIHIHEDHEKRLRTGFRVTDNGIGMSREQMKNLFTPFEQADSSIAPRFGGTGLGLAISQNLVKQMGGEITVESVINEGSVFEFVLDMKKAAPAQDEQIAADSGTADFSGRRILLVEDIHINRVILMELLADTRLEADEAEDGLQAVNRFSLSENGYYDLIFMDVQMPNMDGYEATRQIRALPRDDAKTVPIIAMTANAYREDIDRALDAGMNGHLAKPIDIGEVIQALTRWMR